MAAQEEFFAGKSLYFIAEKCCLQCVLRVASREQWRPCWSCAKAQSTLYRLVCPQRVWHGQPVVWQSSSLYACSISHVVKAAEHGSLFHWMLHNISAAQASPRSHIYPALGLQTSCASNTTMQKRSGLKGVSGMCIGIHTVHLVGVMCMQWLHAESVLCEAAGHRSVSLCAGAAGEEDGGLAALLSLLLALLLWNWYCHSCPHTQTLPVIGRG